jgi:hypothetical protein
MPSSICGFAAAGHAAEWLVWRWKSAPSNGHPAIALLPMKVGMEAALLEIETGVLLAGMSITLLFACLSERYLKGIFLLAQRRRTSSSTFFHRPARRHRPGKQWKRRYHPLLKLVEVAATPAGFVVGDPGLP